PMRIVFQGKRAVFEPAAKAFDAVSCCPQAEFGRKVRTLAGNYQLLAEMPDLLVPGRNPVLWQVCSHKVGRLAVSYLLIAMFVSNAALIGGIYTWLFTAQCLWYLCALVGGSIAGRSISLPGIEAQAQRKAA